MINIAGIHIQAGLDESIIRNPLSGGGSPVLDNLTQPSTHVVIKSIHNNKAGNISAKPDTYSSPKESMKYHIQPTHPIVINPKTISRIFKPLFDCFLVNGFRSWYRSPHYWETQCHMMDKLACLLLISYHLHQACSYTHLPKSSPTLQTS